MPIVDDRQSGGPIVEDRPFHIVDDRESNGEDRGPLMSGVSAAGAALKKGGQEAASIITETPAFPTMGESLVAAGKLGITALNTVFKTIESGVSTFVSEGLGDLGFADEPLMVEQRETHPIGDFPVGLRPMGAQISSEDIGTAAGVAATFAVPLKAPKAIRTTRNSFPTVQYKYEGLVDEVGKKITSKLPKVLQAGRGTPKAFQEDMSQMIADIANGTERALELGNNLSRNLTKAEKVRGHQIMRESIITGKTPRNLPNATKALRQALDDAQQQLIERGLLTPEVVERFQKNFGPYFARLYSNRTLRNTQRVLPGTVRPLRGGTPRLMERGARVEVTLPDLDKEIRAVDRMLGKTRFIKDFRAALESATKTTAATVRSTTTTTGVASGTEKAATSGPVAKLESIVSDALQTRGMTQGEATSVLERLKQAAQRTSAPKEGAPTVETVTQIVKTVRESVNLDAATEAALRAFGRLAENIGKKSVKVRALGKTYSVRPIANAESAGQRVDSLKSFLDDGFIVEKREGRKVTLFRDIPEEVRKELGEIRDAPGFVGAKALAQISREIAVKDFFKRVATNPEWAMDDAAIAAMKTTPDALGFLKMPTDDFRLGDLSGKWVKADIAAEINEFTRMRADWEKVLGRITALWKIGKVTNPATMARNFLSSMEMAKWGGLAPYRPSGIRSYTAAIKGLAGKDAEGARLIAEAKRGGLYQSTFNANEIDLLHEGFVSSRESGAMLRGLDALDNWAQKTKVANVGRLYGSVDYFYKSALYIHGRRELGQSAQEALRYAKKYGIDYENVSPAVRVLRRIPAGAPFISFVSKAIPLAIETAVKHPIRFFSTPALIGLGSALSLKTLSEDRGSVKGDVETIRRLSELNPIRFPLLPTRDKDGRYRFLDLGYVLPYGDMIEAIDFIRGQGEGVGLNFLPPGGPALAPLEAVFNKNMFTGRPIYLETDTMEERAGKLTNHVMKALLPQLTPPIPFTGFTGGFSVDSLRKAMAPGVRLPGEQPLDPTDFLGRTVTPSTAVASKIFGLRTEAVSKQDAMRIFTIRLEQQLKEVTAQMVRAQAGGLPRPEKEARLSELTEKMNNIVQSAEERRKGKAK